MLRIPAPTAKDRTNQWVNAYDAAEELFVRIFKTVRNLPAIYTKCFWNLSVTLSPISMAFRFILPLPLLSQPHKTYTNSTITRSEMFIPTEFIVVRLSSGERVIVFPRRDFDYPQHCRYPIELINHPSIGDSRVPNYNDVLSLFHYFNGVKNAERQNQANQASSQTKASTEPSCQSSLF